MALNVLFCAAGAWDKLQWSIGLVQGLVQERINLGGKY